MMLLGLPVRSIFRPRSGLLALAACCSAACAPADNGSDPVVTPQPSVSATHPVGVVMTSSPMMSVAPPKASTPAVSSTPPAIPSQVPSAVTSAPPSVSSAPAPSTKPSSAPSAAPSSTGPATSSSTPPMGTGMPPASGAFNPCPTNGDVCKILPFGDSITFGIGFAGSYRVHLFELAVKDNKNITFVGHSTSANAGGDNGPAMVAGKPFPKANEGHSGWKILGSNGIDSRVPSPALDDHPHIILLHIGTNDANGNVADIPGDLGKLLDHVTKEAPDALVVVAQIIPLPNNTKVTAYNKAIPALVADRVKAGKHLVVVDLNTGFDTKNLGDGVHPTETGYGIMADKWYPVIKDYLPTAK